MMLRWSSAEVPRSDRLAYWVDVVCRTLADLRCEPRRDQKFFGEITSTELGPLKLVGVRTVAQRASRSTGLAPNDPAGFYHVNITRVGRGLIDQDGCKAAMGPGGFVFCDPTRPYVLNYASNYSASVLRIPRSMLRQRVGAPECFAPLRVDGTRGLGAMVTSMLRELPVQLPIPSGVQERVADNIVDLIAAALLEAGEGMPLSARLALTQVKFWIETHLAEKLSGEEIAKRCSLSVRQLNRLFAGEGSSLMLYVWERRLARCRRDLTDPSLRHRSISQIAFAAGFNDVSHFSRAYRAHYGMSPSEARGTK